MRVWFDWVDIRYELKKKEKVNQHTRGEIEDISLSTFDHVHTTHCIPSYPLRPDGRGRRINTGNEDEFKVRPKGVIVQDEDPGRLNPWTIQVVLGRIVPVKVYVPIDHRVPIHKSEIVLGDCTFTIKSLPYIKRRHLQYRNKVLGSTDGTLRGRPRTVLGVWRNRLITVYLTVSDSLTFHVQRPTLTRYMTSWRRHEGRDPGNFVRRDVQWTKYQVSS